MPLKIPALCAENQLMGSVPLFSESKKETTVYFASLEVVWAVEVEVLRHVSKSIEITNLYFKSTPKAATAWWSTFRVPGSKLLYNFINLQNQWGSYKDKPHDMSWVTLKNLSTILIIALCDIYTLFNYSYFVDSLQGESEN